MIKKIIGIFSIVIGFSGMLAFFESKDFIDLLLASGFILFGGGLIKNSKKRNSNKNVDRSESFKKPFAQKFKDNKPSKKSFIKKPKDSSKDNKGKSKIKKQVYTFNVAGVTKKNNEGKAIQKLIAQHVKNELEHDEPYDGLKNKEILEDYDYGERVYEADVYGFDELKFDFEPMNKYDPNAIKLVHEELGHIGYVPRVDNVKVANIIKNKEYEAYWEVVGGKYKYIDEYEDKVLTEKDTYGVKIELTY